MNKLFTILFLFSFNLAYTQSCVYKGVAMSCLTVEALKELEQINKEFDYKIKNSGGGKKLDRVMKEFYTRARKFKRKYKL